MVIQLRELRLDDVPKICRNLSDLDVLRYLSADIAYPYTEQRAQAFLAGTVGLFPLCCAIQIDENFAGIISLGEKSDIYRVNLELGYWLGKSFWGQGVMTEAIRQMSNVAFRQEGITRVFANVFEDNKSSCRVLEKNGYEQEGYQKNALYKDGEIHNCIIYAVTKEDWINMDRC